MAFDTKIISLNFNEGLIGKSWIDKLNGLEIFLGYVSGLHGDTADLAYKFSDVCIAILARDDIQKELDIQCGKLETAAQIENVDLVIAKGDFPFDKRWYLIGDVPSAIDLAEKNIIPMPFSDFLYNEIRDSVLEYKR